MTALMRAAQYGHADIVRVLLEAGASVEAKDNVSKRIFFRFSNCSKDFKKFSPNKNFIGSFSLFKKLKFLFFFS